MSPVLRAMMIEKIVEADNVRRENMSPEEREKSDNAFKNFAVVAAVVVFAGLMVVIGILFL